MQINKLLTPYNYTAGTADRIKYIVIHYVGALGGAEANCKYYASQYIGASAHYYVGFDGEIWQSVEDQNIAWHCGAKTYTHPECRNANSLGIELCVRNKGSQTDTSRDWYFEEATVQAAIELTKELMVKYNVPADHVIRHYDVTGKICPNPFVYNHTQHIWDAFKEALASAPEKKNGWIRNNIGYWYRRQDGSYPANKWCIINHHYYLFNRDGYMVTGWHRWDGNVCDPDDGSGDWYYFDNTKDGPLEGACWHSRESGAQEIWCVDEEESS